VVIYFYCINHLDNTPINIDQVLVLNSGSKERGRFGLYRDEVLEVGWTKSVAHNMRQTVNGKLSNQIFPPHPKAIDYRCL
jgi:hypothetical protein